MRTTTCDRCSKIIGQRPTWANVQFIPSMNDGGHDRDLCCECLKRWAELGDKFMKEEV